MGRTLALLLSLTALGCGSTKASTLGAGSMAGSAQDYPAKPVRIIDPFGAVGGPDLPARALAPKLSAL